MIRIFSQLVPLAVGLLLAGCSLVAPLPRATTLDDRLAVFPTDFPVNAPVTIHWDKHQVPFIEAEKDEDLAFALGLVHAHLRGGQIELLRRASQGRLAEGMGSQLVPVDHAMRLMNFAGTTPDIIASMPPETVEFLERFAGGLTWYQARQSVRPVEHRVLRWEFEPWTVEDLVTMGRLGAIDITWMYAFRSLTLQGDPYWEDYWVRVQEMAASSIPSFEGKPLLVEMESGEISSGSKPVPSVDRRKAVEALATLEMFLNHSRSGSNVMAVSRGPAAGNGAPLLAADPHVGLQIPPLWLLVGMKSPSYNAVGFMLPGFPVVAIGRNAHGAWGGTNMLAQSTDIVELPPDWEPVSTREERIGVRAWFSKKVTLRESEWGPVISDLPFFERQEGEPELAIRWMGHKPSDEYTAFLRMIRSTGWGEFRDAFETWAVSGQNMIYAGEDGTIGHVLAARLPKRPNGLVPRFTVSTDEVDDWWSETLGPLDLPSHESREAGFLVSTNNRPAKNQPLVVSRFHDSNDRQGRLVELLENTEDIDLDKLAEIQRDVVSPDFRNVVQELVSTSLPDLTPTEQAFVDLVRDWDGSFSAESRGALAAHLLITHVARDYFPTRLGSTIGSGVLSRGMAINFLRVDLENPATRGEVLGMVPNALRGAAIDLSRSGPGATWGDFHRLHVAHPFSNLPLVGSRYKFGNHPADGNTNTVRKAAGPLSTTPGRATYGQNGRALFDLADPDANHFVLFGGQDGWLNSSTSTDQVQLFLDGATIRVPLDPQSDRASWVHQVVVAPTK